jgi:hypothetical protein
MTPYVPKFVCEYCGESKDAVVSGLEGYFVPCQCTKAKEQRDQDHYIRMELRKKARRGVK